MSQALTHADREMFRRLAIPETLLERAGIVRVNAQEAAQEFGVDLHGDTGGVAFPYFPAPNGTTVQHRVTARVRHDHPPKGENGKPRKYESPFGDNRHLYFAPCEPAWIEDPATPVIFVEAEKSALAILAWCERHDRRFIPVALGGCWNWRGRIGKIVTPEGERIDEKGPLPDLQIAEGRKAYVLYDANITKNDSVYAARERFVKALQDFRADVYFLNLPAAPSVNGPDDFLSVQGDATFFTLFENAEHRTASQSTDPSNELFDTWEEFQNAKPLHSLIENFLQADVCNVIGGLSGDGKTLILFSLTKALLSGKPLFGMFKVLEPLDRVVYLIPECARTPFFHRAKLFGLTPYLENKRLLVRTLSKGPRIPLDDKRLLSYVKGACIMIDTASRFSEGNENSANEIAAGLATDIFGLLTAGAVAVVVAHHAPKGFEKENRITLEGILRGSGDFGAFIGAGFGIRQIDETENIIHLEDIKPRDTEPSQPFQIIGRPFIDKDGDFRIYRRPGECSKLDSYLETQNKGGGASDQKRGAKAANLALMAVWLKENPDISSPELVAKFKAEGIDIKDSTVRNYKSQLEKRSL